MHNYRQTAAFPRFNFNAAVFCVFFFSPLYKYLHTRAFESGSFSRILHDRCRALVTGLPAQYWLTLVMVLNLLRADTARPTVGMALLFALNVLLRKEHNKRQGKEGRMRGSE